MKFYNKSRLRIHLITHTGKRLVPCPQCDKTFSTKCFVTLGTGYQSFTSVGYQVNSETTFVVEFHWAIVPLVVFNLLMYSLNVYLNWIFRLQILCRKP